MKILIGLLTIIISLNIYAQAVPLEAPDLLARIKPGKIVNAQLFNDIRDYVARKATKLNVQKGLEYELYIITNPSTKVEFANGQIIDSNKVNAIFNQFFSLWEVKRPNLSNVLYNKSLYLISAPSVLISAYETSLKIATVDFLQKADYAISYSAKCSNPSSPTNFSDCLSFSPDTEFVNIKIENPDSAKLNPIIYTDASLSQIKGEMSVGLNNDNGTMSKKMDNSLGYVLFNNADSTTKSTFIGQIEVKGRKNGSTQDDIVLIIYALPYIIKTVPQEDNSLSFILKDRTATCSVGSVPESKIDYWNTKNFTQKWNVVTKIFEPLSKELKYSATNTSEECLYKCKSGYFWDNSNCTESSKQTSCGVAPQNSIWSKGTYTQNWNGTSWIPAVAPANNNVAGSDCSVVCNSNYSWNNSTKQCELNSQEMSCGSTPTNGTWVKGTFTQTFNGSVWTPTIPPLINNTPSLSCSVSCNSGSSWNVIKKTCEASSRRIGCKSLPANATWSNATYLKSYNSDIKFKKITLGEKNSCGITYNGDFFCWGDNEYGQFGIGYNKTETIGNYEHQYIGNNFVDFSVSTGSICGIESDGTTYCWGFNQFGQLGVGDTISKNVPTKLAVKFKSISAGALSFCGIGLDGYSYCWGATLSSNNGGYNSVTVPTKTPINFAKIYLAGTSYCGITDVYDAYCWGSNYQGQLGLGFSGGSIAYPEKLNIKLTQIFLGNTGSFGIGQDGKTYAWGHNADGQLGLGHSTSPVVTPTIMNINFSEITSGSYNSCGFFNNELYCWGRGGFGDLLLTASSTPVKTQSRMRSLEIYENSACGIDSSDNHYYCFGENYYGQLGINGTNNVYPFQKVKSSSWIPTIRPETNNITGADCSVSCNSGYLWNNVAKTCDKNTRTENCPALPQNAYWISGTTFTQTWDGTIWTPNPSITNTMDTSSICPFQCDTNYTWNGTTCVANTQSAACSALPANADWGKSYYIQTWNGTAWLPATAPAINTTNGAECSITCNTNYTWNGSACVANTQQASCGTAPSNSTWIKSTYTQTWKGSDWFPVTAPAISNISSNECSISCNADFQYNGTTKSCDRITSKVVSCPSLTTGQVPAGPTTYTQTWNGSEYAPTYSLTYSSVTTTPCTWQCGTNYNYNATMGKCLAATRNISCGTAPTNSTWIIGTYSQTWNGSTWMPTSAPTISNVATNECSISCNSGSVYSNATCLKKVAFSSISIGDGHGCGLDSTGYAYCWGSNSHGQLSGESGDVGYNSVAVKNSSGTKLTFKTISAYGQSTCGVGKDSITYCWGKGNSKNIGYLANYITPGINNYPLKVTNSTTGGTTSYSSFATGTTGSCALNGSAYCIGSGIGDNTSSFLDFPTSPVKDQFGNILTFTQLDIGGNARCGISSGVVYCWGSNSGSMNALLGSSSSTQYLNAGFQVFDYNGSIISGVSKMSIDHFFGCLLYNSKIYCWGNNDYKQLAGTGYKYQSTNVTDYWYIPAAGPIDGNTYSDVSVGSSYACGLRSDTKVYCWGKGTAVPFEPIKTSSGGSFTAKSVMVGNSTSCLISTDNSTYCWTNSGSTSYSDSPSVVLGE